MCCWRLTGGVIVWEMKYYTTVKEDRNVLRKRKTNLIGHILHRNCLLNHVIEGKIQERKVIIERRGRRSKQLLEDLKEREGPWKLKEETPARSMWRTHIAKRLWGCRKTDRGMMLNDVCYICNTMTSRFSRQRYSPCKGLGHCYVLAVPLYIFIFTCYSCSPTAIFLVASLRFHADKYNWSNQPTKKLQSSVRDRACYVIQRRDQRFLRRWETVEHKICRRACTGNIYEIISPVSHFRPASPLCLTVIPCTSSLLLVWV